ncbi:MAG: hypothetical protein IPK60_21685 [Sandaracinaceae bacterium]|nr:hypothetical protein [Sandaracinaceae bacterium]
MTEVERAAGQPLPEAWARTSAANIAHGAELVRAVSPASARTEWLRDIEHAVEADRRVYSLQPSSTQINALEELANASLSGLRVQWDFDAGSPGRLEDIGFVSRVGDARAVWATFLREKSTELAAIFDGSILTDTEVVEVDTTPGPYDIVRVLRRRDGYRIDHDHFDVYVTNERSSLGAGTLNQIVGRWNRAVPAAFARLVAGGILSQAEARRHVATDVLSAAIHIGCSDHCSATWNLLKSFDEEIILDAVGGRELGRVNPRRNFSGTVRQLGVPTGGNGSTASIRMRGARIMRTSWPSAQIGGTTRYDGTYNLTSATPWSIDLSGTQNPSGAWPIGRVDRRALGDPTTIVHMPVAWNPSTTPSPDFGSPDAWPANTNLRHGQEIVYGWFTYWQDLFGGMLGRQIPDTFTFELNPSASISGGSTGNYDTAVPGSGQSNHAQMSIAWLSNDSFSTDPDTVNRTILLLSHEFSHGMQGCIANTGASCTVTDPGQQPFRPPTAADWRRQVYDAYVENGANAFALILSEFRTSTDEYITWQHNWRYGGYMDHTDDFANQLEDSGTGTLGGDDGYDCDEAGAPACPGTHVCVESEESGFDSPANGGKLCRRLCTSDAGCVAPWPVATQFCENGGGNPGYCQQFGYSNNWFTTVGTRLAFDLGWFNALYLLTLATPGADNNGTRDFNIGSDSWYAHLADVGFHTVGVTRAVRSATNESGVTSRDDFADSFDEALAVPVLNAAGTLVQWGSSSARYPNLDTAADTDWYLFRGNAFANYTISALPVGASTVDLAIQVLDLSTSGTTFLVQGSNPTGATAVLTTGALPNNDWYAIRVANRVVSSGAYTLRVQLASSADDDFPNVAAEAYPVPNGVAQPGYLTSADVDRFQIYGRNVSSSSLTVTATGSPTPIVEVFSPTSVSLGSATGTITVPAATIALYGTGHYYFTVRNPGATSYAYNVTASFSCASWTAGSCDNQTSAPTVASRYAWGDRFAGRLPIAAATATYSVALAENEHAALSLTDVASSCRFELELLPPSDLTFFRGAGGVMQPVAHWTDETSTGFGPGASNAAGTRRGAGGHIVAPTAGTYSVRVRTTSGSSCTYHLLVSKAGHLATARPDW